MSSSSTPTAVPPLSRTASTAARAPAGSAISNSPQIVSGVDHGSGSSRSRSIAAARSAHSPRPAPRRSSGHRRSRRRAPAREALINPGDDDLTGAGRHDDDIGRRVEVGDQLERERLDSVVVAVRRHELPEVGVVGLQLLVDCVSGVREAPADHAHVAAVDVRHRLVRERTAGGDEGVRPQIGSARVRRHRLSGVPGGARARERLHVLALGGPRGDRGERDREAAVEHGARRVPPLVFDVHRVDVEFVGEPLGRDEAAPSPAEIATSAGNGSSASKRQWPRPVPAGPSRGDSSSVSGSTAS